MMRYLRLLWISVRASTMVSLQYRLEFLVEGFSSLFMTTLTFLPLLVVYRDRPSIGGWSFGESLLVLGFFVLLQAYISGAVNPSLLKVVEQVRQGTLDFILMKPADSQFLVATAQFNLSSVTGLAGGMGLMAWAMAELRLRPSLVSIGAACLLVVSAMILIHALWMTVVSAAIRFTRVDNLLYLFTSLYDTARWPTGVFKGSLAIFFTYVLPLGLMTTWPAAALLERLTPMNVLSGLLTTLVFSVVARIAWKQSLKRYTSASS